jgi:hypothetical protein
VSAPAVAHSPIGADRSQERLRECLQQRIAEAEQADRDFRAMAAVATHGAGYERITQAADRVRRAIQASDQAFAQWQRAMHRRVSDWD